MLRRIIGVPGFGFWFFAFFAALGFVLFYFAQVRSRELDRNGAEGLATISKKYEYHYSTNAPRGSTRRTAYRIDYSYRLPNSRTIKAWKDLERAQWDKVLVGQSLKLRYSLKDPTLHATGEREYLETANLGYGFGWFFLSLAAFLLVHDIRKATPWTAVRFRRVSTALAALALLSATAAIVIKVHAGNAADGLVLTDGRIVARHIVKEDDGDALASSKRHTIKYAFKDHTGTELSFTKTVSPEEYERREVGSRIPVRYSRFDASLHDLHSAELLDISFAAVVLAILFAVLFLPFATRDWRRYNRNTGQTPV